MTVAPLELETTDVGGPFALIPRLFHQIYFPGWQAMPDEAKDKIAALKTRNPNWDYRFYDLDTARDWIRTKCGPDYLETFDIIEPAYYAARADYLRYLLCHVEGGVYMDLKSGANRALDEVLRDDDVYILSQWAERRDLPAGKGAHRELDHIQGDDYLQWFIVSAPGHPFLEAVIDKVTRNVRSYRTFRSGVGMMGVLRTTGPIAYSLAIHPLRSNCPHRMVKFETDLGFEYSTHGDFRTHRGKYNRHYWTQTLPVVKRGPVERFAASKWYGTVQPALERQLRRARKLGRMLRGPAA